MYAYCRPTTKIYFFIADIIFKLNMMLAVLVSKVSAFSCGSSAKENIKTEAERLLNTYSSSVLRMAYSYLHNMNDAEDILQETLIKYLSLAPSFNNPSHEKAWLLRVSANLSKNRLIYNRTHSCDELNDSLVAEDRKDLSFVWEAVKSLPVKYREIIHLYYYEGYKTAQIAEITGQKESTVRSNLMRGRERLKSVLKEACDFE